MKKIGIAASSFLVAFGLVSCSTNTTRENTTIGAVTGAVVGGVAGSAIGAGTGQAIAIGVGAVVGAIVGGAIGESMDSTDKMHVTTFSPSLQHNRSTSWVNTKTGVMYTFTPMHTVQYNGYSYCRKYKMTANYPSHKVKRYYGVACHRDHEWVVVK